MPSLFTVPTEAVNFVKRKYNNCCANCGAQNQAFGYSDREGRFIACAGFEIEGLEKQGHEVGRIQLSVAHLNHKPGDFSLNNIILLCNRCNFFFKLIHSKTSELQKKKDLFSSGPDEFPIWKAGEKPEFGTPAREVVKEQLIKAYHLYPEALKNL